ncbi:hypothetical protein D3C87_891620 [compost metagenome]
MLKNILGFDPEVFKEGVAINIIDYHEVPHYSSFLFLERKEDYYRENLSGNYLVKHCYVSELWLTNPHGKEYKVPLQHITGEEPRMQIRILS